MSQAWQEMMGQAGNQEMDFDQYLSGAQAMSMLGPLDQGMSFIVMAPLHFSF
jgi:hypothetical protein